MLQYWLLSKRSDTSRRKQGPLRCFGTAATSEIVPQRAAET